MKVGRGNYDIMNWRPFWEEIKLVEFSDNLGDETNLREGMHDGFELLELC